MAINMILAVGLNIVKGFAGQVTVGHIALAAIGAYSSAVLSTKLGVPVLDRPPVRHADHGAGGRDRRHPLAAARGRIPRAGDARARGVGQRSQSRAPSSSAAAVGYEGIPPPYLGNRSLGDHRAYYYIVMPRPLSASTSRSASCASDIGRVVQGDPRGPARRGGERRERRKYKVIAFVLSALYAGCAGSLQAHMAPGFLHPNSYTITEMVTLLLMVVLGGIGHIWGGVIGAIVVTIIDDLTRDYYQYRMMMFGAVIVLVVIFMPRGLRRPDRRLLTRRRFKAIREARRTGPSKEAEADAA